MKLETQNGELILPNGFAFDIHVSNPIFSNEGASSIATTLPATNENCRILDRPERLARSRKPVRKFPAVLNHGTFQKKCSMIIAGYNSSKGIEASLAFHESELYADFKGKDMKDIFETLSVSSDDFNLTSLDSLMEDLYSRYYTSSEIHTNFAIFPVGIEKSDDDMKALNEVSSSGFVYANRTIISGEDSVRVPAGYGVSPFLWLHRAVRLIFELSGYNVIRNDFESEPFSKIVLVNTCSDTFCKGPKITFRDLVPSVKVEDFILWLYDRFGAVVAANGKSVRVILQQMAFASQYDQDLSCHLRGTPAISYPISSRIVLKCDTSLESAEPPAESLLLFRTQHSVVRSKLIGEDPEANGVIFIKQLGQYYLHKTFNDTSLGSNCFPYDRDNSEDSEEYSAADRFLPETVKDELLMPYAGNRVHHNTNVANQSDEVEQPIQICYAIWDSGRWFGTTQQYDYAGNQIVYGDNDILPVLTPEGLYPLCWAKYNEILLNAAPQITAQIDYPAAMLMSMDICTPKLLNGVKVMIESFSYQISSSGIKCGTSVMRILPSYKNQLTDDVIEFSEGSFVWVIINTKYDELNKLVIGRQDYNIIGEDRLTDYTQDDAPVYAPAASGIIAKHRTRRVDIELVIRGIDEDTPIGQRQITYEEYFISRREDSE
jgi:hypothetical protein